VSPTYYGFAGESTMNYMGISASTHDAAVAVVNAAGEVVFAEASERHLQNKRAPNCIPDADAYIDSVVNDYCDPSQPLVIALNWSRAHCTKVQFATSLHMLLSPLFANSKIFGSFVERYRYMLRAQQSSLAFSGETIRYRFRNKGSPYSRHLEKYDRSWRLREVAKGSRPVRGQVFIRHYNHHLTHAAAACFGSPFSEAVCAVVDGFGETTSTGYYKYDGGQITRLPAVQRSTNSLGFFYAGLCMACGFDPDHGEEWKVMGLASYGKVNRDAYDTLGKTIRVEGLRLTGVRNFYDAHIWAYCQNLDPADLACTGQALFEDLLTELLRNLSRLGVSENLVFTGGCALNSSFNGKIVERTAFKRLYVFPAPGDDGTAAGAALLAHREDHPEECRVRREVMLPYLGCSMSEVVLRNCAALGLESKISHHPGTIDAVAGKLLSKGKILGWVQGRAEFGPRALGNRSILADPRRPEIKDELNRRVKFREQFRPFAPAILHEFRADYFEDYQESPYMERTLRFKTNVRARIPGVVHVDGTGRVQSVRREWNSRFYDLIQDFFARTGIPLVLNTSFNVMGRPIMHSVEDAISLFFTTGLDALIIGDYLLTK